MANRLVFATGNAGKLSEVRAVAAGYGVEVLSPEQAGIGKVTIAEDGATFEENAVKKFLGYAKKLGSLDMALIADDGGLEIDYLGGEPGVKSRRWRDGVTEMSDQEMIDYCLTRLRGVPDGQRTVHFVAAMAYGRPGGKPKVVKSRLSGRILQSPNMENYTPGYPFRALFFVPEHNMMLHELVSLPPAERPKGFVSHREKAVTAVIKDLFG